MKFELDERQAKNLVTLLSNYPIPSGKIPEVEAYCMELKQLIAIFDVEAKAPAKEKQNASEVK